MALSNVWEVTPEDVQLVLDKHGTASDLDGEEVARALEVVRRHHGEVANAVLDAGDFEAQSSVALETVEQILTREGVVVGPAHFISSRTGLTA